MNHLKRTIATLVAFLVFGYLIGQDKFKEEEVNALLFQEINNLRQKEQLHPLSEDEVLDAVAFDQASYISKLGKIAHEQDKSKKKTLRDRIIFYEGLHAEGGENAALIGIGSKEKLEVKGARALIDTDKKIVKAALISWLEDDDSKLNLFDESFYRLGTSVVIDENNKYTLVAVMASQPYELPDDRKAKLSFFGIEPYKKEVCEPFLEQHPTLPQLLSDAIKVENGEAFFSYHSLPYVEEILSSNGDGLALDLIQDKQFDCKSGNKLFPTEINDGYLFPPIKRAQLYNFNLLKDEKQVKLKMADLPSFYEPKSCELNLVIVKEGHHCQTIPFNNFETASINWFEVPYVLSGKTDSSGIYQWEDTTKINIIIDEQWEKRLQTMVQRLDWINYNAWSFEIMQKTSPIDSPIEQNKIFSIIKNKLDSVDVVYSEEINWKDFDESKAGTLYGVETKDMSEEEMLLYFEENISTDTSLAGVLNRSNRFEISITGMADLSKKIEPESKLKLYAWLFQLGKHYAAINLQIDLIESLDAETLGIDVLGELDPHQDAENLPFISNLVVLSDKKGDRQFGGNPIHIAFLELYLVNKNNQEIAFNRFLSQLKFWSKRKREIKNIDEWYEGFSRLSKGINKELFARMNLNYNLIAADHLL